MFDWDKCLILYFTQIYLYYYKHLEPMMDRVDTFYVRLTSSKFVCFAIQLTLSYEL